MTKVKHKMDNQEIRNCIWNRVHWNLCGTKSLIMKKKNDSSDFEQFRFLWLLFLIRFHLFLRIFDPLSWISIFFPLLLSFLANFFAHFFSVFMRSILIMHMLNKRFSFFQLCRPEAFRIHLEGEKHVSVGSWRRNEFHIRWTDSIEYRNELWESVTGSK